MWRFVAALCALSTFASSTTGYAAGTDAAASVETKSPIKHVIILIGENRGFDHTFGVYKPKGKGQTISNLLSKGIVKENGQPGPSFALAQQFLVFPQKTYFIAPKQRDKVAYGTKYLMPQPNTSGAPSTPSENGEPSGSPPFGSVALASVEPDLEKADLGLLTTGSTGEAQGVLDKRIPGAGMLAGPFPLLGPNISDDDYMGDAQHEFYEMWQQVDCNLSAATKENPSGCQNDLYPFVMATFSATDKSQGNEMGFYDAEGEEVSLLKTLADRFTLSDNYHQPMMGGTAANHIMLGSGDDTFWTDGNGTPIVPPASLIANPNPVVGTNNRYTADNSFSNCSDVTQPGVKPIVDYLNSLPYDAEPNCQENHYYVLNDTNAGFLPNGALAGGNALPPSPLKTIGDELNNKKISWAYFAGSWNDAVILSNEAVAADPTSPNLSEAALNDPAHAVGVAVCEHCSPFQYSSSIMANPTVRAEHMKDTVDLIADIKNDTLPSVSFGKPDELLDGHPQRGKIDLYEAYVEKILDALDNHPKLKATTAVFVTWDEGGGFYDSGYIQPLDFFGDGPRTPLLILSAYSTGGMVNHTYTDHVSILKFIERNWKLQPLTDRSRDNLPNPTSTKNNPYVPTNPPAIGDLFDAFNFDAAPNNQPYTE
ncbi:MAG: alkaline phosphatase family protein [Methylocella sp.]